MSPSCCLRSPPLLVLALCLLMVPSSPAMPLQPGAAASASAAAAASARSDLEESASGDDILSGTDFLSVFIGAAMPPGPRSGRAGVASTPAPDSNALGAYGARLIPKPKTKAVKNIPAHARLPLPPPPPPPPPPPLRAEEVKVSAESQSRFQDLSHSKTPSAETVSFDPTNVDSNPLPEASARILHRVDPPKVDRSKVDDTTKLATSEYYSQTSKDESTTNSDAIVTTGKDNLVDLAVSDVDQETQGYKSDLTIITEVVTSREELLPTEATNVVQQESSDDDETPSVILLSNERGSDHHSSHVQAPPDDSLNAVAITIASEEETSTVQESDAANTAAPPYPPPPPPPVQQVVSVRVSSSVVQGPSPAPQTRSKPAPAADAASSVTKHDGLAQTPAAPASEEEMQRHIDASPSPSLESPPSPAAALVTEERPTNIAVQRSEFSVEEAAPSSSELPSPGVFHKTVARVVEVSRNSQSAPVSYHTSVSSATSGSRVQFYSEPPSYHREVPSNVAESIRTSVVTSHQHTGGDAIPKFEHVSGVSMGDETIESRMGRYGTPHHEVRISGANEHISFSSEVRSSQEKPREASSTREHKSFRHSEQPEQNFEIPERNYAQPERSYAQPERSYAQPERVYVQPVQNYGKPERNYGQPERNYGQPERNYAPPERTYSRPEQNYEVDEAVSVMTNGRAHGIQGTTPVSIPGPPPSPPPAAPAPPPPIPTHEGPSVERAVGLDNSQSRDPNHKFGYVVEGRNFRKYRVEERTPDGFIVGEYGVVSHDDGSLRGVRYTADGTINPQLIYEALVKFLSL